MAGTWVGVADFGGRGPQGGLGGAYPFGDWSDTEPFWQWALQVLQGSAASSLSQGLVSKRGAKQRMWSKAEGTGWLLRGGSRRELWRSHSKLLTWAYDTDVAPSFSNSQVRHR